MFAPDPGYLNTASLGVPPLAALTALHEVLQDWGRGRLQPPDFDEAVNSSRRAWASLSGVDAALVATGSTVSQFVGLVAASLPDGARVVTAAGDFTSVLFPFLAQADRGVRVEEVPLEQLASVRGRADLVAVSAVQSADGRLVDLATLLPAVSAAGARLLLDTTQSCGWLPLDVSGVDYVVCGGYQWLLSPRGTAFFFVRADVLEGLRPLAAGWYADDDPWTSIYGSPLRLAADARRLDLSPAWFSWTGAAVALELLAGLDGEACDATTSAWPTCFSPGSARRRGVPAGCGRRSTSTATRRTSSWPSVLSVSRPGGSLRTGAAARLSQRIEVGEILRATAGRLVAT